MAKQVSVSTEGHLVIQDGFTTSVYKVGISIITWDKEDLSFVSLHCKQLSNVYISRFYVILGIKSRRVTKVC